jgi:hypothetical protein
MNAPYPSRRSVASRNESTVHAPALVRVSRNDQAAANDETEPIAYAESRGPNSAVNPLWMITAGLALFFALMAVVTSS